jgi:NDP-sugar pyrophosphorylase family protein
VEKNAVVRDSIIMAETRVCEDSRIDMSIVDEEADIGKKAKIGAERGANNKITVLGKRCIVRNGAVVDAGKQVDCGATVLKEKTAWNGESNAPKRAARPKQGANAKGGA